MNKADLDRLYEFIELVIGIEEDKNSPSFFLTQEAYELLEIIKKEQNEQENL